MRLIALLILSLFLSACKDGKPVPKPEQLTRDAEGFYCHMIVLDHPGPKAQIFEKGRTKAIWFTSVRDALAYRILPGEAQDVQVIYVNDMAKAKNWDKPEGSHIWIKAVKAFYVINSKKRGGMGAKETVPFGDKNAAEKFARDFGGKVVLYSEIPPDYILGDEGEYDTTPMGSVKN